MTVHYETKIGDSYPSFQRRLGVDLTSAKGVAFQVSSESGSVLANREAEVVDAGSGTVAYHFDGDEVSETGFYVAEFVVVHQDGTETFPRYGQYVLRFNDRITEKNPVMVNTTAFPITFPAEFAQENDTTNTTAFPITFPAEFVQ